LSAYADWFGSTDGATQIGSNTHPRPSSSTASTHPECVRPSPSHASSILKADGSIRFSSLWVGRRPIQTPRPFMVDLEPSPEKPPKSGLKMEEGFVRANLTGTQGCARSGSSRRQADRIARRTFCSCSHAPRALLRHDRAMIFCLSMSKFAKLLQKSAAAAH